MVGSHANGRRETGQDGNVAAISVPFVVPWNNPAGVGYVNIPCGCDSIKSARPTFFNKILERRWRGSERETILETLSLFFDPINDVIQGTCKTIPFGDV